MVVVILKYDAFCNFLLMMVFSLSVIYVFLLLTTRFYLYSSKMDGRMYTLNTSLAASTETESKEQWRSVYIYSLRELFQTKYFSATVNRVLFAFHKFPRVSRTLFYSWIFIFAIQVSCCKPGNELNISWHFSSEIRYEIKHL